MPEIPSNVPIEPSLVLLFKNDHQNVITRINYSGNRVIQRATMTKLKVGFASLCSLSFHIGIGNVVIVDDDEVEGIVN